MIVCFITAVECAGQIYGGGKIKGDVELNVMQ